MFYTNACLQHQNFNQDEWLELENWVRYLQDDSTDRISVFSGPIYTRRDRTTKVIGIPPAEIPTAFFKVVCYVNKSQKLATVAFLMAQDAKAISDRNAKSRDFDLNTYQVSVKMIEEETGLVFNNQVNITNPIPYTPPPTAGTSHSAYARRQIANQCGRPWPIPRYYARVTRRARHRREKNAKNRSSYRCGHLVRYGRRRWRRKSR